MAEPSPERTLAVLLGASWYNLAPRLAQGRAFANSAHDFREYLLSPAAGMGLPRENVSWLFEDSRSPGDQLRDLGDFLDRRFVELKADGAPPLDLIVFYVGHGLFCGPDHAYHFAVRGTDERREGLTSIRASELALTIKDRARFVRKFLILDCCFSAAIYREFQSGPLQLGREKLLNELPHRGTTLLCSASAQDASLAPGGTEHTMFSDSLLRSLHRGNSSLGPRLSLNELGDLIKLDLQESFPRNWVRPEVHSPDQREGDVASVGLFPNRAYAHEPRQTPTLFPDRPHADGPFQMPAPTSPGTGGGSIAGDFPPAGDLEDSAAFGVRRNPPVRPDGAPPHTTLKRTVAVALAVCLFMWSMVPVSGPWKRISATILVLISIVGLIIHQRFVSHSQRQVIFLALCLALGFVSFIVPAQLRQFQDTGAIILGALALREAIEPSTAVTGRHCKRWIAYVSVLQSASVAFCAGEIALLSQNHDPSDLWFASFSLTLSISLAVCIGTLITGPRTWAVLSIPVLPLVTLLAAPIAFVAGGTIPAVAIAYPGSVMAITQAYRAVCSMLGESTAATAEGRPTWILRGWLVSVAVLAFALCLADALG